MCGDPASFLELHRGKLAINIKVHSVPELGPDTRKKLLRYEKRTQEKLLQYAEEALRESWWSTVRERANELKLGDLSSDGRSSGWLVFDMTFAHLEALIEDAERHCAHCGLGFSTHVGGKCLLEASNFESEELGPFETWEALRTFSAEVKESLKTIGGGFDAEVQFQIEQCDTDYEHVNAEEPITPDEVEEE